MAESKRALTILIVEDSPVQGKALQAFLEERGFQVLWALDGADGVTMAQIHLPDFIVMDIEMPRMNGIEACRQLKSNFTTQEIPVVMLTGQDDVDALERGFAAGAADFIPKDMLSGMILVDTLQHLMQADGRAKG